MKRRETRARIVGIDWLELFCSEAPTRSYTPDAYRARGWCLQEREYGTKTMEQMFTLLDQYGKPFVEIRRSPRGLDSGAKKLIYQEGDCYIKLSNLYCYDADPIGLLMDFCKQEKLLIKKIYRIDIFSDFETFDSGDSPAKVVRRIVNHTYSKVNQAQRRVSGTDTWTECLDNWISWGRSGSMVNTKIYDKSKELRETGMHKPYIPQLWKMHGYIDDVAHLTKNGKPVQMWRVEFSIKGNARGWIYIDKDDTEDGAAHGLEHNLLTYSSHQGVLNAFANLVPYYFHFKIYEEGKRKSLCKDKVLFIFDDAEVETGYRLTNASDYSRVRPVDIEDDVIAVNHLIKAKMKMLGTEDEQTLTELITKIQHKIDTKAMKIYTHDDDVF